MKKGKIFMLTAILLMFALLGFGVAFSSGIELKRLDVLIFVLIVVIGVIALYLARKKDKSIAEGFPAEDEMSLLLKYKSGYYAFMISMYMWLFIFFFKDKFPDVETMLGGGVLLSALIFYGVTFVLKRGLNE
jgi:Predicted membrane protein (DUF2178)